MYTVTGTDINGKRHSVNTTDYKHAMTGAGVVVKGAVWTNHTRNGKPHRSRWATLNLEKKL